MKLIVLSVLVVFLLGIGNAFATDQILITKSFDLDKVIFDGKWSFYTEWKKSSWNPLTYGDGTIIHLRTAHQGNFIYVFIDDVKTNSWSIDNDRATICFDKDNSKSKIPDSDDYCFVAKLSGKDQFALQGDSQSTSTNNFRLISNPQDFIGIGAISDQNDRYTPISHPSYEFRIPTDLIGRSADYGFYLGVYHAQSNKTYSWPQSILLNMPLDIPSPSEWGEIISPDKSIPEFPLPILLLMSAFSLMIYFSRLRHGFHTMNRS